MPGFTISQELVSYQLTLADGSPGSFSSGSDATIRAFLTSIGVTTVTDTVAGTATMKVNNSDNSYYGITLAVTIKDTIVGETTWFDTTEITINFTRPPCLVDQTWLTSQEATPALTLTAE